MRPIYLLHRWQKRLLMMLADVALLPLAVWAGFAMRLGSWTPEMKEGVWLLLLAPLVSIPIFARLGLYRAIIRFLGHQALQATLLGTTISTLALMVLAIFLDLEGIPRSVYPIYFCASLLLIGGSRHAVRQFYAMLRHYQQNRIPVAIYGAGASGAQLALALFNNHEYRPALFLDDNRSLQKSFVHSLKVYPPEDLPRLIAQVGISQVLLAMPSAPASRKREILALLEPLPVHVRSIPPLAELVSGQHSIEEVREIEIDELLGRACVTPDPALLERCIRGKVVMVTGAGGSIGSELCRQIVRLQARCLVLFELSEFSLYQIESELRELAKHEKISIEVHAMLGSVQNQQRVTEALREHHVQTLYHAAAYKHVPLVEQNPLEGIQNNVLGTFHTAQAAYQYGIEHFVLISTDKAVRPTNVMGASKRMAELVLQAFAQRDGSTRFSMVRFGNVLGSSGSVVPLFRRQIKAGGPITVTHPDIIRYFMTIPEAAQLVIQAGAMAKGGEVFLLNMGEPVKIVDLARRMVRLSGLQIQDKANPDGDIRIEYTGLRPGEKLYEELLIDSDAEPTRHPRIFQAKENSLEWDLLGQVIQTLREACGQRDTDQVYTLLETYVHGYQRANLSQTAPVETATVLLELPLPFTPLPLT